MDSTAQIGHAGIMDWQEECYQKLKRMKEQYFLELSHFHQGIAMKVQQQEAFMHPGNQSERHAKMKNIELMLKRMLALLQIDKSKIPLGLEEKLPMYETQMSKVVASSRASRNAMLVHRLQQLQHLNITNAHPIPQQWPSQVSRLQLPNNHTNQRMKLSEPVLERGAPEESSFGCPMCKNSNEKRKESVFSCPICMCALASPFSTVCGHIFCEVCIKAAIQIRRECPTCRTKLTGRNNIHRVYLPLAD